MSQYIINPSSKTCFKCVATIIITAGALFQIKPLSEHRQCDLKLSRSAPRNEGLNPNAAFIMVNPKA